MANGESVAAAGDNMKPPMDANERELILKEEVYAVVGCAIEVLNVRGHGLHEKIYENCICVEFRLRGIPYTQQERHRVMYKGEVVGEYVPDLVVQGKLIVDTKTIERITDHERGQMLNYLCITGLPAGVILNFKHARLDWERLVLTQEPRMNANQRQLEDADFQAAPQRP
jgi:GxxExxY protein